LQIKKLYYIILINHAELCKHAVAILILKPFSQRHKSLLRIYQPASTTIIY